MSIVLEGDAATGAGSHVTREELALYVMDALEGDRKQAVEDHVFACEACADGLAGEARLEAAFEEVARRAALAPVVRLVTSREEPLAPVVRAVHAQEAQDGAARHARQSRWAGGVAGALAAAAAIVLAFASSTGPGVDPMSAPSAVSAAAQGSARAFGDAASALSGGLSGSATLAESGLGEWQARSLADAEQLDGG